MNNFSFEPLKLKLATNNIIIPMENGVADLTNAETSAKIMLAGKELFPVFDDEIGGRNLLLNSDFSRGFDYYWDKLNSSPSSNFEVVGTTLKATYVEGFKTDFGKLRFVSLHDFTSTEHIIISAMIKGNGGLKIRFGGRQNPVIHINNDEYKKFTQTIPKSEFGNGNLIFEVSSGELFFDKLKLEKGTKATPWTPAPEEVLQNATLSFYNCSAAIVGDLVKITSHKPETTRGWVDVTVNYGNLSNTKRLNWSVEGVEPYNPLGTLLTMNNRGIKL